MILSKKLLLPAVRLACLAYWLLLSVLLLVPDPLALLGIQRLPGLPTRKLEHFILFTLLTVLVHASRLPIRRGLLVALLLSYAIGTEMLQSLIPHRAVELLDFLENLCGLAAGTAIWWLARTIKGAEQ